MRQHIFVAQGDIIVEKGQVEVTSGPDDRTHIKRWNGNENKLSGPNRYRAFVVFDDTYLPLQNKYQMIDFNRLLLVVEPFAFRHFPKRKSPERFGFVVQTRGVIRFVMQLHNITV